MVTNIKSICIDLFLVFLFMKCFSAQRHSPHRLMALLPAPTTEKSGQCVPTVALKTISSMEMPRGRAPS